MTEKIKVRKEKFGYLACNIETCNVYEIPAESARRIMSSQNKKSNLPKCALKIK
ncbi:MAG: hypothetical protein V1837_02875 [Candidatus Woesearchaeota archaeon]